MAAIDISSPASTGGAGGGNLQLLGGASMTSTLTAVTDTSNVASTLKLSTTLVQTTSTLKITTADNPYIDAEDNSGNNRFTIGRDPSSQQVNLDFASNPTGSTTNVGAIRTYVDGVNLSEVISFREDGLVGLGTTTPTQKLHLVGSLRIQTGGIYDGTNSIGTNGQVLSSTGTETSWITPTAGVSGSGTTNFLSKWSASSALTNSLVFDNATSVGIGTSSPAATAILDLTSTTQGLLPPRMTDAQRAAIASPAEGLILFNTDNKGVAYRDGTNWGYLSGAKQTATGSGGTLAISFASGNIVDLTLTASTTLTFAGHVVGTYIIQVTQGGTGSYTLTYPASVKWSGGTAPTLTTAVGKVDILTFYHDGTSFFGTYSLNY